MDSFIQTFHYLVLLLPLLISPACCFEQGRRTRPRRFYNFSLGPAAIGPESIAFDCHGRGPYVGVSDGRILRLDSLARPRWTDFAVMPNWSSSCFGLKNSSSICGRPLGLKFHPKTCELYAADAYNGLVLVGPEGGQGLSVAKGADGIRFKFTNALDTDMETGFVYFTDTSARFERGEAQKAISTRDKTGRLMVYNPHNQEVKVLLNNLSFANGVALSQNKKFLLVCETTTGQIRRLWLDGPRYHTSEVFLRLQGRPDNIHKDDDGNFWIAQVQVRPPLPSGRLGDDGISLKFDEEGRVLERLDAKSGEWVLNVSDVVEFGGRLWIGYVANPYIKVSYKM